MDERGERDARGEGWKENERGHQRDWRIVRTIVHAVAM